MNHLNYFFPYESKQEYHEDQLTRAFMVVLKHSPIVANLFFGLGAEAQVDREIQELRKPGLVFDEVKLKQLRDTAIRTTQLSSFVFVAIGVVFIVLGLAIYKAPVPCTVTALVLYLGGWLITVVLSMGGDDAGDVAKALMSGIIIKIIIVVSLAKSIQSAIAYQKESKEYFQTDVA